MKRATRTVIAVLALILGASVACAGDEELCLDCHVPAEDWEGLSAEDILAEAKNMEIRRHADNADLSDEQLKTMIVELRSQ